MKKNVSDNPVEVRAAVPPPHFDDRRVLQRAQRVVSLEEIRRKLRLRRFWYFSGALAIAMMLGAASALVAVRIKLTSETQPATNNPGIETVATQTAPQLEQASLVEEETPAEPPLESIAKPTRQTAPAQRPRVVEREFEPLEPRRRGREPSEKEQLEQIRESVLYDQWQERRARRTQRPERRNRGGDRDLTNVGELFEGPRRPERPRY